MTLKLRKRQKPLQNRTPFWGSWVLKELLESDRRIQEGGSLQSRRRRKSVIIAPSAGEQSRQKSREILAESNTPRAVMQPGLTGSCFHFPAEELTPVPQVFQIPARVRPETLRVACVGVFNGISAGKGGQAEERDQGLSEAELCLHTQAVN